MFIYILVMLFEIILVKRTKYNKIRGYSRNQHISFTQRFKISNHNISYIFILYMYCMLSITFLKNFLLLHVIYHLLYLSIYFPNNHNYVHIFQYLIIIGFLWIVIYNLYYKIHKY